MGGGEDICRLFFYCTWPVLSSFTKGEVYDESLIVKDLERGGIVSESG